MIIDFIKMHGCGNDFLVVDLRNQIPIELFTTKKIIELADYKRSIGFDQLLLVKNSNKADIELQIFNNDGMEVEACGNGSRCVASLYLDTKSSLSIATKNRILAAKIQENLISINMGKAKIGEKIFHFDYLVGHFVHVGNPHIIIDISNYSEEDADKIYYEYGPLIENDSRFIDKINVNFIRVLDKNTVRLRTWERGVGPTLACGTGACASFSLLNSKNIINNKAMMKQTGGDLVISIEEGDIIMAGEAKISYQGTIDIK